MKWLNWATFGLMGMLFLVIGLAWDVPTQQQPEQERQVTTQQNVEIRPLTDIYANNPPMLTTITHNAAVLTFESSIPVACSVVFGETDAFGMIAADPNMDGAAIIDHRPIMGGLAPETTYVYRLQGSDANGILYVSDVMTFTTAADPSANEINVAGSAVGATVTAFSSQFNATSFAAANAIDDNPATEWSSAGDGDSAYIEITFDEPAVPHAVEIWSRSMATSSQMFTVTVTADTGELLGTFHLNDEQANPTSHRFDIAPTTPISGIRLDVNASSGLNTGLKSLAVYAVPPTPLGVGISTLSSE